MPKRTAQEHINSKKVPIFCGHKPPEKSSYDYKSIHSRCSRVAYTGCQQCILKYLYTVYKKDTNYIEGAKKFVCECVCWGREVATFEIYKTLKFCYSLGLLFGMQVFEFNPGFTRKQILWLLNHGAPYYCLNMKDMIKKQYWEIIGFIASNENVFNEIVESKNQLNFYLPSNIISIVLLFICEK
jgi:hypothetical protein